MKLGYNTKAKDPTYYIQMGIRNGTKTTTKNICTIGKHSELLKITDNPLAYAREQVAEYNKGCTRNKMDLEVKFNLNEKIRFSSGTISTSLLRNVGYLYLQKLYNALDIDSFFNAALDSRKISFKPDTVNRFLTYSRILNPDSKLGTMQNLSRFYDVPQFDYQHILRTMDFMAENYNEYIAYLFNASKKIIKRDTSVCYYDCTNYYSETESNDVDYTDPITGENIIGLRKYGISKEHRPNPIVEMGLFMDTNGIPISMCIAPGNTNEQTTVIPLEHELVKMFGEEKNKFIYCADAGLGSYHIRNFNSMGGRAFIVTQSIKKLSDELQSAVFKDSGYRLLSNDKQISVKDLQDFDKTDCDNLRFYNDRAYKVLKANTLLDVGLREEKVLLNGRTKKIKSKGVLKQYVIITFSRKTFEYQRYIRNRQIERAVEILKRMDPDSYKKGPNDVTRFIRKRDGSRSVYELDTDKIAEEEKYDGFYAVATNLEDSARDILAISEQRYKIEDCFRVLKTDFTSRPYYHRNRERIIAHFMICYTALLIYRLLEVKINNVDKAMHFTTRNIIETLQNMNVANIEDMIYAPQYSNSKVLNALEACFHLGLDYKYFRPTDLNKRCRKNFSGICSGA